jgi:hypothetical protein
MSVILATWETATVGSQFKAHWNKVSMRPDLKNKPKSQRTGEITQVV